MSDSGKTVIITGAGAGIGRACAELFLQHDYNVGLLGRRAHLLEAIAATHSNALALACDVTNADEVTAAFKQVHATWGRLDVLFNNAGQARSPGTIDEIPIDDWLAVVDVNLNGAFFCAREAFRAMRAQTPQGGRIINNGSISAHVPRPGSAPYTSTKHAITGLTRSISLDGRPYNIACGQIDIGNALTEMAAPMTTGVPQADGSVKAEATMDVAHVASSVLHMANLPLTANVQFMTVLATNMPYIGRG